MKPLRLYANLRFADAQGSKELLKAILEEVQDDSIDIVGNEMTINIGISELSKETKNALLSAEKIHELHFGKNEFREVRKSEGKSTREPESAAQEEDTDSPSEQAVEPSEEEPTATPESEQTVDTSEKENTEIPENEQTVETSEEEKTETLASEEAVETSEEEPTETPEREETVETSEEEKTETLVSEEVATSEEEPTETPASEEAATSEEENTETPEREKTVEISEEESNVHSLKKELDAIAENSDSYDSFVESVAKWCNMNSKTELFKNFVYAAGEIKKDITWKNLGVILNAEHFEVTAWMKNYCTTLVRKHFEKLEIKNNILGLIKEMLTYREKFEKQQVLKENTLDTTESTAEDVTNNTTDAEATFSEESIREEETATGTVTEETVENEPAAEEAENTTTDEPKTRFEFDCIPMDKQLKETLRKIDEEKVKSYAILRAMGLELTGFDEQGHQQMNELIEVAVCNPDHDIENIMVDLRQWEKRQNLSAVMKASTFINDYARKNGATEFVKVETFITELREIVLTSEAKN